VGVVVVGISWLVWDYYQNLEFERESNANNQDENNHMNNRDESQQALVALILPGTVWFTCFYRGKERCSILIKNSICFSNQQHWLQHGNFSTC